MADGFAWLIRRREKMVEQVTEAEKRVAEVVNALVETIGDRERQAELLSDYLRTHDRRALRRREVRMVDKRLEQVQRRQAEIPA